MPTFEFVCEKCSHEFEELVLRRDEVVLCPHCGSDRAKKQLSAFAVTGGARLKGNACGSCKPSAGKCGGCCGH